MVKRLFSALCILVLLVSALAVTAGAQPQEDTLKAGYSTVDLNPYWSTFDGERKPATMKDGDMLPLPMGGYGDNAHRLSAPTLIDDNGDGKISASEGDGLHATCLAIQSGGQTAIIITVDIISFKSAMTKQVRDLITEATGIPGANIMINGTHTHGGVDLSATFETDGEPFTSADGKTNYTAAECTAYLESYKAFLVNQLAEGAKQALADLTPATMEKGTIDAGVQNGGKTMNGVRHYVQKFTERNGTSVTYVRGSSFNNNVNNDTKYDSYYTNCYTGGDVAAWRDTHISESDDAMHLLRFKVEGKDDILLLNWRGHPASSNKTYKDANGKTVKIYNTLYSDYIGSIRYGLDSQGYRTTFILGASGNLGASSALSWEDWVTPQAQSKGLPFAVEYGRIVANTAKALLDKTTTTASGAPMKSIESGPVLTSQLKYRAKIQIPSALEIAACKAYQENAANIASHDSFIYTDPATGEKFVVASSYHANAVVNRSGYSEGAARSIELDVITVGNELSFIAMPYEASDRYSMEATMTTANNYNDWDLLSNVGSFGAPFVMTCSNDHIGYIPNHLAYNYNKDAVHYGKYAAGSYESQISPIADGEGEKLMLVYRDMLEQMYTKTQYCQHCKETVTWLPLTAGVLSVNDASLPAGHYFLAKDLIYADKQVSLKNGNQVCLDLNGNTYAVAHPTNASRALNMSEGAILNIFDFSEAQTGKIMGRGVLKETAASFSCGTLNIGADCTVNLYSGTLTQDNTEGYHAGNGGVVRVAGTFNMYGGTVTGGISNSAGGNIYVAEQGVFHMHGGTVSGGTATTNGGNVYVSNTSRFTMSGGKIIGGTASQSGPSVYVSYSSSNKHSVQLTGTTDGNDPVQITFANTVGNMLYITGNYAGKLEIKPSGSIFEGMNVAKCDETTDIGNATITVVGMGDLAPVVSGNYIKLAKRLGWMQISGVWYYFYENNKAQTGWFQDEGDWHYFDETGAMQTGWLTLGQDRYFLDAEGHRVSGVVFTGDSVDRFDENGLWVEGVAGWYTEDGHKYYADENGKLVTGWQDIKSTRYYFDQDYKMHTGWLTLSNGKYYLDETGTISFGWVELDGKCYYFNDQGIMQTGWLDLSGTWYYLKPTGEQTIGWLAYGPVWYYFNDDGTMFQGFLYYGGQYYFFNNIGRMHIGWTQYQGKWYYMDQNGYRVSGIVTIDGKQNQFDENGVWIGEIAQKNGWVKESNKWYYYKDGAKLTGWLDLAGTWYYFNPRGEMTTGWLAYGPVWYYFNSNGDMRTGWLTYGGQHYYFDTAATNYGRMVVNKWIKDSGKWYYFDANGYRVTGSLNIGGKVYNFNSSGVCLNP